MVSKSINSDTTSTSGHCSLFCSVSFHCLADSCITSAITAIFLVCHKFQIVNAVICFVLVLMIDLHTLWNNTFMSHIDKPMNSHVLFDSLIIAHINLSRDFTTQALNPCNIFARFIS